MWTLKTKAVAAILFATSLAGTALYAYSNGKRTGERTVQAQWDREKADIAQAITKEIARTQEVERALHAIVDQQRRSHRNEVNRIVREHAALVDGMRERPDRPGDGDVPEGADAGAGVATGCTGAELYRPDGLFLAGEAARADQLRVALKACIAHTAEVERQLNR